MIYLDKRMRKAFTLIELITVVIIVAILASLAIPNYIKTVERAKDKEAIINLKLIAAGEKLYKLSNTAYYPQVGLTETEIGDINTALRLDLNESNWDYSVSSDATTFYANAFRQYPQNFMRIWRMNAFVDEPGCTDFGGSPNGCP